MKNFVLPVLASALMVGCGGEMEPSSNAPARVAPLRTDKPEQVKSLRDSQTDSSRKLLGQMVAKQPGTNFMISPWSLGEAFGMLRLGATGETDKQLAQFLGLKMTPAEAASASSASRATLAELIKADILRQANGVFVRKGETLEKTYLDAVQRQFGARVAEATFPEPGLAEINQFVSDNTRGKIPKLFEELSDDVLLVLVNAISFKDKWEEPFEKDATRPIIFHVSAETKREVPMMTSTGDYRYAETESFQSVAIPYKSGLQMVMVLPKGEMTLGKLAADAKMWAAASAPLAKKDGTVTFPKWRSEFKWDLKSWMTEKGFGRVFDQEKAELRGIRKTGNNLYVSQAVQKTFIQVDEEGTEAAAATGIEIGVTSAPMDPEKPFEFLADRPFAYLITDSLGTPYFVGVVSDPKI